MLNLLARGLSPLTRGKQAASATSGGGLPVHPRSREENAFLEVPSKGHFGSSPLTRGKLQPAARAEWVAGLIPTHAGKT